MTYPIPLLRAAAATAIPGCHFAHGSKEEANIDLDKLTFDSRVVLVEDRMLVSYTRNKFGLRTAATFQATVSVLGYAKFTDSTESREPRMNELLQAADTLLRTLEQHPQLRTVTARSIVTAYNQFDANLDGVVMNLDITPLVGPTVC